MARMISKAKTSSVTRAAMPAPSSNPNPSAYCRDVENWPRSWMGLDQDLPPGEALLACFRPFLAHLASASLSRKTIRRHVDNLWMLGGEIIRDLHEDPSLRKVEIDRLLDNVITEDGGPLLYHGSEEEQRSFDSTCRKFHRFLSQNRR